MALPSLGAYELDQTLGRSALGTTYAGQRGGAPVVIKVLELAPDVSETERKRATTEFRRRAEGISGLYHAGIVALRDYGIAPPFLYAVSGLVVAGSLVDPEAQRLLAGRLDVPIVLELVRQVAQALQEAHRLGIAHGNLKPSNIFIAEERNLEQLRLQVGDFALISEAYGDIIPAFGQRRMWRYLAPEARNAAPKPAGDQFALAAMAYEWLTGQPAFAEVPLERRTIITPITDILPTLSPFSDLDVVLGRAFALAPDDRFPSITAFAEALSNALGNRSRPTVATVEVQLIENAVTQVKPDLNDTRPSREMPVVPPTPPVAPPRDPSAFLLDGPNVGPRPPTADLARMAHQEEALAAKAGSAGGNKGRRGRKDSGQKVPVARGPTTREQELMAPPAARDRPRLRQRQRAGQRPPDYANSEGYPAQATASYAASDISRRDFLTTAGKWAFGAAVGVGGIVVAAKVIGSVGGGLGSLFGATPHHTGKIATPHILTGHVGSVQALQWSPDGSRLASGAATDGTVRLWDITRPQAAVATLATNAPTSGGITDLSWARDSHYLMVSANGTKTQIWNVGQQTIITQLLYSTQNAQWHPQADIAALVAPTTQGSKTILVWDLTNAKLLATLTGHTSSIEALAWANTTNSLQLASGDKAGQIFTWEGGNAATLAATGDARAEDTGAITTLAWATNAPRFLTGSADATVRLWDAHQPTSLSTWSQSSIPIGAVTWLAGSTIAAIGLQNGTVVLWNSATKQVLLTLSTASTAVNALSWSRDGRYLAAGASDHQIYVWDTSQFS